VLPGGSCGRLSDFRPVRALYCVYLHLKINTYHVMEQILVFHLPPPESHYQDRGDLKNLTLEPFRPHANLGVRVIRNSILRMDSGDDRIL
jgi:hypothetical protein